MNQLATQCDEAEVDIKEHEEMLGKIQAPSRNRSHYLLVTVWRLYPLSYGRLI